MALGLTGFVNWVCECDAVRQKELGCWCGFGVNRVCDAVRQTWLGYGCGFGVNWVCGAVGQTWLGYWCAWLLDSVGLWCRQTDMVRLLVCVAFGLTGFVMPSDRHGKANCCLLYTSPSPRDQLSSRMPSSA